MFADKHYRCIPRYINVCIVTHVQNTLADIGTYQFVIVHSVCVCAVSYTHLDVYKRQVQRDLTLIILTQNKSEHK